jgi:hypothetical protein
MLYALKDIILLREWYLLEKLLQADLCGALSIFTVSRLIIVCAYILKMIKEPGQRKQTWILGQNRKRFYRVTKRTNPQAWRRRKIIVVNVSSTRGQRPGALSLTTASRCTSPRAHMRDPTYDQRKQRPTRARDGSHAVHQRESLAINVTMRIKSEPALSTTDRPHTNTVTFFNFLDFPQTKANIATKFLPFLVVFSSICYLSDKISKGVYCSTQDYFGDIVS